MSDNSTIRKFIIVSSDESWSDIWHTQLHYSYQLSKRYEVIFMNPPKGWKFSNLFRFKVESIQVFEHLTLTGYYNFLPSSLGKWVLKVNDKVNEILLNRLLHCRKNQQFIFWHFDPFRSLYTFSGNTNCKHIYHVIDPIAGHHHDLEFSKMANLVVITSPKFLNHYTALNKNVLQISQGVDLDFYRNHMLEDTPDTLISKNSVLLLGTISDDIDFELLGKIALRFPVGLVLIGPDKTVKQESKNRFKELLAVKGVHWLGPMKPENFKEHVMACKIGIIAYDSSNNQKNNLRSPLKVISYLGCHKPVISNIDCEIPVLLNKAIYFVDKEESYFNLIEKCYTDQLNFDTIAVDEYLASIDYNYLLKIIFSALDEPLASRQ
ncbi:MAG: hypothetical protein IPP71_21650 [Bacteroidetes bacterium]|nr:hypothetical protein [Bacteroidota bacterium]